MVSSACSAHDMMPISTPIPTRTPRSTNALPGPVVNGCASLDIVGPSTMNRTSEIRPTLDTAGRDSTAPKLTPAAVLAVLNALS